MSKTSRIKIKKFNGQIFELWKIKMEDIFVDREQWVVVKPRTKLIGTSNEDMMELDRKARSTIQICLVNSVPLNMSEEETTKKLWDKICNFYQSNSMVNK